MELEDIPEVIVCANDHTAVIVIQALQSRGIQVPERCAVTGFDNTQTDEPILASVHINKENLGTRAVDQLLWRIKHLDEPYERKLIYSELIIRDEYNASIL